MDKAQAKANAQRLKADLCRTLQVRFNATPVPADLLARIEGTEDLKTLERWFDAALVAASLEAFRAAISPTGNGTNGS